MGWVDVDPAFMAQPVTYKKPRVVNVVSVIFVIGLLAACWVGYEVVRVGFLKQEAYRMLEETGSGFSGRRQLYRRDAREVENLRNRMESQIRSVGVDDPGMESWIEIEGPTARFGAVFTVWYRWPFDVLQPYGSDVQIEHVVTLPD